MQTYNSYNITNRKDEWDDTISYHKSRDNIAPIAKIIT